MRRSTRTRAKPAARTDLLARASPVFSFDAGHLPGRERRTSMTHEGSLAERARRFFSWRVLIAIVFWGVSWSFTKVALASFHPNGLVATRMWIGAAALALLMAWRREGLPERDDRPRCALLGAILAVHIVIQAFALRVTTAISSGWIIAFNPVVLALFAQMFLGERVLRLGWIGIATATGGLIVVALAHPIDFGAASLGDALILASCITWPLFTILGARPTSRSGALRVTTSAMVVAATLCSIAAFASGWLVAPLSPRTIFAVVFLGVGCNAISFALWMKALDLEGSAKISAMLYFQPFVTMAWGWGVDREPLTVQALLGGPLVLFGVWLLRRGTPARARSAQTMRESPATAARAPSSTSVSR
jgi:drug/metabolite transporter (DMT)-like permease